MAEKHPQRRQAARPDQQPAPLFAEEGTRIMYDQDRDTDYKRPRRKKKRSGSDILYTIAIVIFAIIFLVCAGLLVKRLIDDKKTEGEFAALSDLIDETAEPAEEGETNAEKFARLVERNSEFIGWISIEGTNLDYPVMQTGTDRTDYYLRRDFNGEYDNYGTPYLDWECSPDSPFSIVYGHHMDDGSVFADFARFSDRGYAEGHRGIRVRTRAEDSVCEQRVAAVDVVDADEERVRASFGSDGERVAYLNDRISSSDLVLEEADLSDAKVWAFATCSYQTSNSRTVVYAIENRR